MRNIHQWQPSAISKLLTRCSGLSASCLWRPKIALDVDLKRLHSSQSRARALWTAWAWTLPTPMAVLRCLSIVSHMREVMGGVHGGDATIGGNAVLRKGGASGVKYGGGGEKPPFNCGDMGKGICLWNWPVACAVGSEGRLVMSGEPGAINGCVIGESSSMPRGTLTASVTCTGTSRTISFT